MTICELENILVSSNVPEDMYSLKGGLPSEAYCLEKKKGKWHLYYSNRGKKNTIAYFDKEDAATKGLLSEIKKTYPIQ